MSFKKINLLRKLIKEEMFGNQIQPKDDLFGAITFADLIDTVQSNESNITPATVNKIFNELMKSNLTDAKHLLNKHMDFIIKSTK